MNQLLPFSSPQVLRGRCPLSPVMHRSAANPCMMRAIGSSFFHCRLCPDLLLMMPIQDREKGRKEGGREGGRELSAFSLLLPMFFHLLPSFLPSHSRRNATQQKHWKRSNISETTFSRSIGIGSRSSHTLHPYIVSKEYCFTKVY